MDLILDGGVLGFQVKKRNVHQSLSYVAVAKLFQIYSPSLDGIPCFSSPSLDGRGLGGG
jgi:hypothetical protein